MAASTPELSDDHSQWKHQSGKKNKNQISWLILVQICIEVLYVCSCHANLTIVVTVTIYYAAKHDVNVCGQRDLALLKMVMCQ